MSTRSLFDSAESADTPTFTCEVCKISVRSAQKLQDHVNFSPLHKAALEGNSQSPFSPSKGRSCQRRILYDGTKLFWRVNETLELCIYEDVGNNCVTITGLMQQETSDGKVVPLLFDRRSVIKAAADDPKQETPSSKEHHSLPPDVITKYLLARLQAKKDPRTSVITLFLQKLKDDEIEPTVISQLSHHHGFADLSVRRRHTFDEVKIAQKEVNVAAEELKRARQHAENLSNSARMTLEAFSKRRSSGGSHNGRDKTEWLRVYDRVTLKNAVDYNKELLNHKTSASTGTH